MVDFFYSHPTWLVGLLVVGLWTAFWVGGLVVFHRFVDVHLRHKDTETVGLTYAIVAVIYAVLIALVVVDVWETFAKSDEIATAEANKLSNLMFDAEGLPPAQSASVKTDLSKYIDIVVKKEWPSQQKGDLDEKNFEEGWMALAHLSTQLAQLEPTTLGQAANKGEMLRAVNDLIKARRSRILAAGEHLPEVVWQILLVAGGVAVAYTYMFGAHSFRIHIGIVSLISATISLVFTLIIALDYPFRGDVSVSDEAFVSVQRAAAPPASENKPPAKKE